MKPLILVYLSIILALTNVAGAVTILSENYYVGGRANSSVYSESNSVPPVTGSCGAAESGASSSADYFEVYADAFAFSVPPDFQDFAAASASSTYEIQPSDDYLRIEIENPWSDEPRGRGGFSLTDQTDNMLIASRAWSDWSPKQERISFCPVDTEHQYEFCLFVMTDSVNWPSPSKIKLTGGISSVPEPATLLLLGLGGLALLRRRRQA